MDTRVLRLTLALVALSGVLADSESCSSAIVNDYKLKQKEIQHLVDTINKPVYPDFKDTRGIIDESKLKGLGTLPRREVFSLFDERNWAEAAKVVELLLEPKTFREFIHLADIIHHRVNEDLFLYALSVAIAHRPDCQGVQVPRVLDIYPDKFLRKEVIHKIKEVSNEGAYLDKVPVIDATEVSDNHLDPNQELLYFLEDLGMNSHHHHWHVIHPAIWLPKHGGVKDRKGELFFYMHKQMVARYDTERLSNDLPRVRPFENWNDPIDEGYSPHLIIDKTGYKYAYRPQGVIVHDLPNLPKTKMFEWKNRIMVGIRKGSLISANKTQVPLNNDHGIDLLGDVVESSLLSVNRVFYGNLHCYAHVIAGKVTDPQSTYGEKNGAMYDVATSARDPLFYSWHKFIDNIFQEHKETLQPYNKDELNFPDVQVDSLRINVANGTYENIVRTYWQNSLFKIAKGFTFTTEGSVLVKVKHLNHETFYYNLEVTNNALEEKHGVVRIFGAVINDERGHPYILNDQRHLVIELDKFTVNLKPGKNSVRQPCYNSAVTAKYDVFYGDVESQKPQEGCNCGWPDYMLLPKGKYEGLRFRVFAIVTNHDEDKVSDQETCLCGDAVAYCGAHNQKYPDKKPMGFPFDRRIDERTFEHFHTPNMIATDVIIKFTGEFLPPKGDI
uniref:Hemocyanin subunit D n=1 Tax=Scutigera coleoptrata TaxID=29022 RepID=HCYD_SCUCO|nr:RecName: Full=Hemocyanin subunit D; Flags: Precursor [Scutigera coleoptrata]CAC69247.1 hemocyanin subunit D [Scutigera coleoptrata]